MAEYRFVTVWSIQASQERTWAAFHDRLRYAEWWPAMRRCHHVNPSIRGVGALIEQDIRGRLPFRLRYISMTTEFDPPRMMACKAIGDLDGEGRMTLEPDANGGTTVTFHWNVRMNRPFLKQIAPLLRPLMAWSHRSVMKEGEAGLNIWLNHPIPAALETEELRLE